MDGWSRWATRLSVVVVLFFLALNVITGPGVPGEVSGRPALIAHTTAHFVSPMIYALNTALMVAGFVTVGVAVALSRAAAARAYSANGRGLPALVERFVNGRIDQWSSLLCLEARISKGRFELLGLPLLAPAVGHVSLPLSPGTVMWFVAVDGGWKIADGPTLETSSFEFSPRNPRRWFDELSRLGVTIRPARVERSRLPNRQVSIIAQMALAGALLVAAAAALALTAFLILARALRVSGP
jgi:hypothetical protein